MYIDIYIYIYIYIYMHSGMQIYTHTSYEPCRSMEKRVQALATMMGQLPESGSRGDPPDPEAPLAKRQWERVAALWRATCREEAKRAAWRAEWHRNVMLRQELFENRLEATDRRQHRETKKWNALGRWRWDPARHHPCSASWFWDNSGWWWRPTALD